MNDPKIEVLDGISAIRLRPGMYIGSTYDPYHLMQEILDNALDELSNNYADCVTLDYDQKGNFVITDNGRGIPIHDVNLPNGQTQDSVIAVVTQLHSGAKFNTDAYQNSIGLHGVGLVVVNALSTSLTIAIKDKNKKNIIYFYEFIDSTFTKKEIISQEVSWSTRIQFSVNPSFFDQIKISDKRLDQRLKLISSSLINKKIILNGKQIPSLPMSSFVKEYLGIHNEIPLFEITEKVKNEVVRVFFTYDINGLNQPESYGDVNLNLCEGTYITNFLTLFYNTVKSIIKDDDNKISRTDIMSNFRCYVSLSISEPKFDSQNKVRMSKNVNGLILCVKTKLEGCLGNQFFNNHFNLLKEQKSLIKASKKLKTKRIRVSTENPLIDCAKIPGKILYILEGDSAGGTLKQIRDVKTEAIYPLSGKVLNVVDKPIDKIIDSKKMKYLFETLGIDLTKKNQTDFRYEKIKILCDGDSVSAETEIVYLSKLGFVKKQQIQYLNIDDIDKVYSFNPVTLKCELKDVKRVIKHEYNKNYIYKIITINEKSFECTDDHSIYVLNLNTGTIEEKSPIDIDIEQHVLVKSGSQTISNFKSIIIDVQNELFDYSLRTNKKIAFLLPQHKYKSDLKSKYIIKTENGAVYLKIATETKQYLKDSTFFDLVNNTPISSLITLTPELVFIISRIIESGKIIIRNGVPKCRLHLQFKKIENTKILDFKIKNDFPSSKKIIHSNLLFPILKYLDLITPELQINKRIPELFYSLPTSGRVAILQGFENLQFKKNDIDITEHNNPYEYSVFYNSKTENQDLIDGITLLLKQLDIPVHSRNNKIIKIPRDLDLNKITQKTEKTSELIKIQSITQVPYTYNYVYDLEVEDNNNFAIGTDGFIVHNSDGYHISVLVSLIIWKYASSLITNSRVNIILPPLYGAVKGKQFIPIYNQNDTSKYKSSGYSITRFKGLGEMNPNQLEVVIRNPIEYVITPPVNKDEQEIIDQCLTEVELKRRLCQYPDQFNVKKLINLTAK